MSIFSALNCHQVGWVVYSSRWRRAKGSGKGGSGNEPGQSDYFRFASRTRLTAPGFMNGYCLILDSPREFMEMWGLLSAFDFFPSSPIFHLCFHLFLSGSHLSDHDFWPVILKGFLGTRYFCNTTFVFEPKQFPVFKHLEVNGEYASWVIRIKCGTWLNVYQSMSVIVLCCWYRPPKLPLYTNKGQLASLL